MHAAWFNEGAATPTGTTVPIIYSNSASIDPQSLEVIIAPNSTLITIADLFGRTVPATTTIKFDVNSQIAYIRQIENTSAFQTYTAPFTMTSVFPGAASYVTLYIAARAFDTITGASQQSQVYIFQTRALPQN